MLGKVNSQSIRVEQIGSVTLECPNGSWSGITTQTFDVKSVYSNYKSLRNEHFILLIDSVNSSSTPNNYENSSSANIYDIKIQYNASTGILTVAASFSRGYMISRLSATLKIMITPKILGGGVLNPLVKKCSAFSRKVVSRMLGRILGVNAKQFFPSGYKLIVTGTFPGISDKVIPILVNWNCSCSGTGGGWSSGGSFCYYDNGSKYFKIGSVSSRASATQAYGYGDASGITFLPYYFNYNWELMKTITNTGGTVIAWLEKVGS